MSVNIKRLLALVATAQTLHAGSATWNLNPTSGNWNTASNWTPATVPNGPSDMATFDTSSNTAISVSANTEVNGITYSSGAGAFTTSFISRLNPTLTLSGVGITNNSTNTQSFVVGEAGSGS